VPTPLFTAETAAKYAQLSVAARKAKSEAAKLAALNPTSITQPAEPQVAPFVPSQAETNDFTKRRLMRVRKQLNMVDSMLEAVNDADDMSMEERVAAVEKLQRAQNGLSEQERKLAMRPDPGSHRPSSPRRSAPGAGGVVLE
jgi:hypothetical protein